MAVTPETPQASRGFMFWQQAMFRHAPTKVREILRASQHLKAMTKTRTGKG
jgi:hypothetical protein